MMQSLGDSSFDFYAAQYARFGSKLAAEIRREAYGQDFGQQGWRTKEEQDKIVSLIKQMNNPHVLDIACGSGGPSLAFAKETGCRLTGVDIEQNAISTANDLKNNSQIADRVKFEVADCGQSLPFEKEQFDLILCIDAILHLQDREAVFADWFRLLKPGGYLLFTDAAVVTGAISKQEMDIRASQGIFVCVPRGYNELKLETVGFRLGEVSDTTDSVAAIAGRLFDARQKRHIELQSEESEEWYSRRQKFLRITGELAADRKLSRYLYLSQKSKLIL
jgi:ubiquinone/menaquinone biosynthesis C-methylase UbiE